MIAGSIGLATVAGILSILSPCVLPLLPIVFGTAASEHRAGPIALAGGVALSFVGIGLFVATIGFAIGLDGTVFRTLGASLMLLVGAVLTVPVLQAQWATSAGPISQWADQRLQAISGRGIFGQFAVGLLLGAVWSPCVGPTLGAASVLAAQGKSLDQVALVMAAFGLGAALPLAAIGLASRQLLTRWRGRLMVGGKGAKMALGFVLIAVGAVLLTGFDRQIETLLVDISPDWLTALTTRY